MICEKCQKTGNHTTIKGIWLCCGQLHCPHIQRCPSCGAIIPFIPEYTSAEYVPFVDAIKVDEVSA